MSEIDKQLTALRETEEELQGLVAYMRGTSGSIEGKQSPTLQEHDAQRRLAVASMLRPQGKRGRPQGSGTYATNDEFLQAVVPIIQDLRHKGVQPSQVRVAELLPGKITVRQVQRWVKRLGLTWESIVRDF